MCVCSYDRLTFAGLLFVLRVRGCENQCDFALELNRNQQVVAIPACVKAESVREEQEEAEGLLEPQSVGLLSAQLTVKMLSPFFFYFRTEKDSQPASQRDRQTDARAHRHTLSHMHSRTCTHAPGGNVCGGGVDIHLEDEALGKLSMQRAWLHRRPRLENGQVCPCWHPLVKPERGEGFDARLANRRRKRVDAS